MADSAGAPPWGCTEGAGAIAQERKAVAALVVALAVRLVVGLVVGVRAEALAGR